jgi:hypothetical protein
MILCIAGTALAARTFIGTLTFTSDGVPQYVWVDRYPGSTPYLHIVAHSDGSPWCTVDILEWDGKELYTMVRTSRHVPGDGGEIFHQVTAGSATWEPGNVALVTWGGGAPSHFDVWALTDTIPEQTPWEDWWYSDPANPDQPCTGGILLDAGTDVEHPVTYTEGQVFTGRLNVRRYSCFSSAIKRVEFDLHFQSWVWIMGYSVLAPFTDIELAQTGPYDYHVSVWADDPVYADPVYACQIVFDPATWSEVVLSNCVFTNAMDSTYSAECFANLRANWRQDPCRVEACSWGKIKAMYR